MRIICIVFSAVLICTMAGWSQDDSPSRAKIAGIKAGLVGDSGNEDAASVSERIGQLRDLIRMEILDQLNAGQEDPEGLKGLTAIGRHPPASFTIGLMVRTSFWSDILWCMGLPRCRARLVSSRRFKRLVHITSRSHLPAKGLKGARYRSKSYPRRGLTKFGYWLTVSRCRSCNIMKKSESTASTN
jgi:hypothetical protein